MMLRLAIHMTVPPYWAVTAGPNSHSPPPMLAPAIISPGPISAARLCHLDTGAGGSSPTSHGGIQPAEIFVDSGGLPPVSGEVSGIGRLTHGGSNAASAASKTEDCVVERLLLNRLCAEVQAGNRRIRVVEGHGGRQKSAGDSAPFDLSSGFQIDYIGVC